MPGDLPFILIASRKPRKSFMTWST